MPLAAGVLGVGVRFGVGVGLVGLTSESHCVLDGGGCIIEGCLFEVDDTLFGA